MTSVGTYDAATKTLTMKGRDSGPEKTQEYDMVTRFIDKDRYVTEVYFTKGGQRVKVVEGTAVRKKS